MIKQANVSSITWRSRAHSAWHAFINTLFPPVCVQCRKVGSTFCANCRAGLHWLQEPVCNRCGCIVGRAGITCDDCQKRPLSLAQIRAAVTFAPPVTEVIHSMKYNGYFALAEPLAELLVEAWGRWQTSPDLVIPIPLHPHRERKRGYNQSALLARYFAQQVGLAYSAELLRRVRHTPPQVGLNAAERLANVNQAFWADPAGVAGKHMLLIDDVCTTGATLAAAAEALRQAGAESVSGYCVARTA